jgi:hypothetical protein
MSTIHCIATGRKKPRSILVEARIEALSPWFNALSQQESASRIESGKAVRSETLEA